MENFSNVVSIIVLVFTLSSRSKDYTVESILEQVKDCSDDISIAQLDYSIGKEDVLFYQSEAMPQVSFTTGLSYVAQSIEARGLKAFADQAGVNATHADGVAMNWALNIRQPIFSFGRVIDALKIAAVRKESLEDEIQLKKDLFYFSVIAGYCNVYLGQSLMEIAQKSIIYYKKLLDRAKQDLETGNGIRRDSLTLQALVYKAESDLVMANSKRTIAIRRLSKLTEITMEPQDIHIRYDTSGWASNIPENIKNQKSLEITLKEQESLILQYNADYEKGAQFPSINFISQVSNDLLKARDEGVKSFIKPDPDYWDYFNPEYFNVAIGLQVSWNVFDGRRSQAKARKARLTFEKVDRLLKVSREENEEKIHEAKDALEVLKQGEKAVLLQLEALTIALKQINIDYSGGFADYATILDLERQLREAEKYLNEIYMQRLLSVAQLKLASGLTLIKE